MLNAKIIYTIENMKTPFRVYVNQLKSNVKEQPAPTYYVKSVSRGTKSLRALCDEVEDSSAHRSADLQAAVALIMDHAARWMQMGYAIQLDNLGSFSIVAKHEGEIADDGKVHARDVHFKKLRFQPAVSLRHSLEQTKFVLESTKVKTSLAPQERQDRILALFAKKELISARDCMALNHCSRATAVSDLTILCQKGLVLALGTARSRLYQKS